MTSLPTEHSQRSDAERLHELFLGADTRHGTYDPARLHLVGSKMEMKDKSGRGPQDVKGAPTPDLWEQHLAGSRPLGVRPPREDGKCRWGVIDVDVYDGLEHGSLAKQIQRAGLPLIVCRSKSGGAHLYLFATDWMPQADMSAALTALAGRIGHADAETYPPASGAGNWLNMPYFDAEKTNRHGIKPNGLAMALPEFLHAAERARISPEDLMALPVETGEGAPDRADAAPTLAEFERMLARWLRDIAEAAPGDANNTLWHPIRDAGRWASLLDIDEHATKQRFREAWHARGKEDSEFEDVWRRNFEKGRRLGNPPRAKDSAAEPIIRRLADVPMEPIEWLWPGRFAIGKLSMLAGHPGLGKSQLTMYMAAQVSRAGFWPFGEGQAPLGRTLVLSAEDDVADTLRPRFEAAGGDAEMVDVLDGVKTDKGERGLNLAADVQLLDRVLAQRDDYRLVIIDPISAYLGRTDTHTASEVRSVLAPIQKLAEQHRVAVVCVSHLVKAGGTAAINAVNGSGAFVAAARIACIVTREMREEEGEDGRIVKAETGRRIVSIAKNNLGPDGGDRSLAYSVESRTISGGLEAPRIAWDEPVNLSADEAVGFKEPGSGRAAKATEKAERFLRRILRDGPVPATEVEKSASAQGISESTLKRARREIGVVTEKKAEGWVLHLPGRQEQLPL